MTYRDELQKDPNYCGKCKNIPCHCEEYGILQELHQPASQHPPEMLEPQPALALHWLAVAYCSPIACQQIREKGGQVRHFSLDNEAQIVAVAIPYFADGTWTWSHGRQELRRGIEFWPGEIQSPDIINLNYRNFDGSQASQIDNTLDTYIIDYDEEIDPATKQVRQPAPAEQVEQQQTTDAAAEYELGDIDEHPF